MTQEIRLRYGETHQVPSIQETYEPVLEGDASLELPTVIVTGRTGTTFKINCTGPRSIKSVRFQSGAISITGACPESLQAKQVTLQKCEILPREIKCKKFVVKDCTITDQINFGPELGEAVFESCHLPGCLPLAIPPKLVNISVQKCTGLRRIADDHRIHKLDALVALECPDFERIGRNLVISRVLRLRELPKLQVLDATFTQHIECLAVTRMNRKFAPRIDIVKQIEQDGTGLDLRHVFWHRKYGESFKPKSIALRQDEEYQVDQLSRDAKDLWIHSFGNVSYLRGQVELVNATEIHVYNISFKKDARLTLRDPLVVFLFNCDFGGRAVDEVLSVTGTIGYLKVSAPETKEYRFTTDFDNKADCIELHQVACAQVPVARKKLILDTIEVTEKSLQRYRQSDTFKFSGDVSFNRTTAQGQMAGIQVAGQLQVRGTHNGKYAVPFRNVTCGSFYIESTGAEYICEGNMSALSLEQSDACTLRLGNGATTLRNFSESGDVQVFPELRCYQEDVEIMTQRNAELKGFGEGLRDLRVRYEQDLADDSVFPRMPKDVLKNLVEFMGEYPADSGTEVSKNWIRCVRSVLMGSKLLDEADM